MTSFREGLPSVVLEAITNGLFCVSTDVGSIGVCGFKTVHLLPMDEYPKFCGKTITATANQIRTHLRSDNSRVPPVNFTTALSYMLRNNGINVPGEKQ